jgi:hypothetical protein
MRRLPDRLKLASCIPLADSLSYTSTTCKRYWRLLHSAETRHYTLTCEIPVTRSCPGLSTRWVVLFLRRPCTAVSFSSCRKRSGCYDLLKHLIPGSPVGNSTSPTTAQQHGAHVGPTSNRQHDGHGHALPSNNPYFSREDERPRYSGHNITY